MKAVVFSYNHFYRGQPSGWSYKGKNGVLLIQPVYIPINAQNGPSAADSREQVVSLWSDFQDEISQADFVVLYLGRSDAKFSVIGLAVASQLKLAQLVFVSCSCNESGKLAQIAQLGYEGARLIPCICGGQDAMLQIFNCLLNQGRLPEDEELQ